ncbi:MAG: Sec-independent protein translocase subunit TatA [Rhodoglobus sp.]
MPNLRPVEILLIVVVVLLLFGAKRLPDLAKSVGRSLKILKTEVKELSDDTPATDPAVPVVPVVPVLDPLAANPVPVQYVPTAAAPVDPAYRKQQ